MKETKETTENSEFASLKSIFNALMIDKVPNYGNRFFYSLGFLSMISFVVLVFTGLIEASNGPTWWLTNDSGKFFRSIHLWATQAFVIFMILHLIIVFLTSGFKKPRRLTWVLGAVTFIFVLLEAEFGYILRGDFSSQWRSLQAADLFNGSGLGVILNPINYLQIYGIHLIVVPIVLLILLFSHYLLVKIRGVAKPYLQDVPSEIVPANHNLLFLRGFVLIVAIIGLAIIFPSPYLKPTTINEIAQTDPGLLATTLSKEFDKSSDTATYVNNIAPYTFDSRLVFIEEPYKQFITSTDSKDILQLYKSETTDLQDQQLKAASAYYAGDQKAAPDLNNPAVAVISSLVQMAKSGLYESSLALANPSGDKTTYISRFLADTGALEETATSLGITTEQYGMLREESKTFPLGAWWLAPVGVLNHTVLAHDDNGDRDGAYILGLLVLILIAIPFIPFVNRIPEKLKVYLLIWGKPKQKVKQKK